MNMRRVLLAIVALFGATAAQAQDWAYEDLGVPIAYVDNGGAQFQFACRGGDLTVGFWVRAPHRAVADAASMNIAIIPDPRTAEPTALDGASFAQDMPLIHNDGSSVIIRGPVAQRWAQIAQKAAHTIRVAYVRKQRGLEVFDSNEFGASGSAAAIKKVLARCG